MSTPIEKLSTWLSSLRHLVKRNVFSKGCLALALFSLNWVQPANAGGWYVSNTAPTEWIRYQKVYFSAGSYRFTARVGSPVTGSTLHLEIDNVPVQTGISVPNTGRADVFNYVHLGTKTLTQGYHDLKIVFNSADISIDWFMLSKDADTASSVKPSDITMLRPDTSGMLIAPIVAFGHVTSSEGGPAALVSNYGTDHNLQPYSDAQMEAWYGVPMYRDFDRRSDRYWDNLVDELMASRAQVPLLHCRETKDFTRSLRDRNYQAGPGHFEGRWLLKFAEAVARNPQAASSLKIGMFWENGGIADLFNTRYGYYPGWGDPALADYVMEYHLSPWFEGIPASMLYQPVPGRPIISLFANHPEHIVNDGRMADFVAGVRSRLQKRYGYNPLFVLPAGGHVTAAVEAQGWGQCPWGTWDGPMLTPNVFKGDAWGTTCAGSRRRLDTVWMSDWNPATNTGTPAAESPGVDNFRPRIDGSGNSVLLDNFAQAKAAGMKLVQQEGFTNMAEGNSIYRSYHPGWSFPNQHMAAMREYADPTTRTMIFEAEACDDYHKVVNDGNSGGSYRKDWYGKGNHLDVYRPLHNLQNWIQKGTGPGNLTKLSAGTFDVWAVASDGKVWAQQVAGVPGTWVQVTNAPSLTSVAVSKDYVWGLNGTTAYSTKTPYGWQLNENTSWTVRAGSVVQISAATSEVWGVNASGDVFRRPINGSGSWTQVAGTMDKVFAGDAFVWGIQGSNLYRTRTSSISWVSVPNPHGITQLAVGAEEVWGATASGQIYRRSASGIGGWDLVSGPGGSLASLTVGEDYAWTLVGNTPSSRRLEGFQNAISMAPLIHRAVAGNGQATLIWTAVSGATGYNIKRGTSSGGPYSTIQSNIMPASAPAAFTDSIMNGTTYYYVVSAVTPAGETPNSQQVVVTPRNTAPTAPSNLTANLGSGTVITLHWSHAANSEEGFKIERKVGSGSFVSMGIAPGGSETFDDTTALAGLDYTYRVRAYNAAGDSAYSNELWISTSARALNRAGWTATASAGGSTGNALDGNASSRWSTGAWQTGGEWFQVDMKNLQSIYQIDLWTGGGDYPRKYQLHLSSNGVNWVPVTAGSGLSGITTLTFEPQTARYIRITQTSSQSAWWSINELNVYGQTKQTLNRAGWLFSASISSPFASNAGDADNSTRWTSGVSTTPGQWFQVDMGTSRTFSDLVLDQSTSTNDYPSGYQVVLSNDGVNWGSPVASGAGTAGTATVISFPEQTARYIRVIRTGTLGSYWSIHEFYVYGEAGTVEYLDRSGWSYSASASSGSNPPADAGDGNITTRWGSGAAQANGQWFQIDMGNVNRVGQLILDAGTSANDYPRGYQVRVSNDGTNWGNPVASGSGNSAITRINLAPHSVRYVRVTQTGTATNWWSIYEANVVGESVVALDRTGWTASASVTGSGSTASNVLDGSTTTRWTTGTAQSSGQWFQVDMGSARSFNQIVLDAASATNDYLRGYEIFVSNDGVNWGNAIAYGSPASTIATIPFPRQTARYIRVVQTATAGNWWAIYEFNVYDESSSLLAARSGSEGMNIGSGTAAQSRESFSGRKTAGLATDGISPNSVSTNRDNRDAGSAALLPSPWRASDIGLVGVAGSADYQDQVHTLAGSGNGISGVADAFHYVYQTASGDCSIVARVSLQENAGPNAKAGLVLRESTAVDAIQASVMLGNGIVDFQWRESTGGPISTHNGGTHPLSEVWLKLTRSGNAVSGFVSSDGFTWTQIGEQQPIAMAFAANFGLAVTSQDNATFSTAIMDHVIATP